MSKKIQLLAFGLFLLTSSAFSQISFRIPLQLSCGTIKDTLYFGVNPNNTIGIDDSVKFGVYKESMAPPLPPPPFPFDARFKTLPGRVTTYPTGLGTGSYADFRPYIGPAQVDSFRISISGDDADNNDVVVSWPSNLSNYATKWTIKPISGSDWPATDMLKDHSVTITSLANKTIIIIKEGAKLTSVERIDTKNVPFELSQNYPNPFNPSTEIEYSLPKRDVVRLDVFSSFGKQIMTLDAGYRDAGTYRVQFDASTLSSGVYFYRLTAGSLELTRAMLLVR